MHESVAVVLLFPVPSRRPPGANFWSSPQLILSSPSAVTGVGYCLPIFFPSLAFLYPFLPYSHSSPGGEGIPIVPKLEVGWVSAGWKWCGAFGARRLESVRATSLQRLSRWQSLPLLSFLSVIRSSLFPRFLCFYLLRSRYSCVPGEVSASV